MASLTVSSRMFVDGGDLPLSAAHASKGGSDTSPHLAWAGEPAGTRSFAVTCWDPDAPTTVGFTHWVRVGIPGSVHSLDGGAGPGVDALTDWGETRYGGAAPPKGDPPHRYQFTVYALDATAEELGLDARTTYAKLRFLTRGHVLAAGTITGRFADAG